MNITKGKILGFAAAIFLLVLGFFIPSLVENVDASSIVVIQSPVSGALSVYTEPGWKWQGFGSVTTYPRRAQFSFSAHGDQGKNSDESIQTRFNDGGHGNISGVINWAMPLSPDKVVRLHKDFHGAEAIEQMLIRQAIQKVIFNVGPTMSSTESSAERRPDIPKYIDDQLANGPYLTKTVTQTVKDTITGQDKQAAVVVIAMDDHGLPVREAPSVISNYGIMLQPVTINDIKYDPVVEKQIKERQNATTQVQIAIANAKKAEQDAITIAKQGEADAAKAKWKQEVENAKDIASAEKRVKVAQADLQASELFKKSEILKGEGEASRKRAIMEADGQLDKKLEALVKINEMYAQAIAKAQPGAWSSTVNMGADSKSGGINATSLVDLMTAKTAREIGVDLSIKGAAATKK